MSVVEDETGQELPPFKPLEQKPPLINVEERADGSIVISSQYEVGDVPKSIPHEFKDRVAEHPDRNYLGKRTPAGGDWKYVTYGEMYARSHSIAQALIDRGMGPDTPLMILSGNSLEHAALAHGAQKARVPIVPVSVPYSLMSKDHAKLKHLFNATLPKMIFADDGELFGEAINDLDIEGIEIVTIKGAPEGVKVTAYDDLINANAGPAVDESMELIDADTIAKYLFTSGSTGMPKGVVQTQGMFCAQIASGRALRLDPDAVLEEVPQTLDWQPWNHISGGNVGFNAVIAGGATHHIDDGRPIPGMFDETIRNLREIAPLNFASAPIAFTQLADALERDEPLRKNFFKKLKSLGYGGATLSNDIYDRLQKLAIQETGMRIPLTTMYGATETQGITVTHWITERVGLIGLPLPGMILKLVPNGTKLEVRVKGPTVTPGYLNQPEMTAEAFDEEGFYKLGDAAKFLDPDNPLEGLVFDGRVTEDYKLSTGTWVSAGTLRADLVAAGTPLIRDAVVCGQDKDFVGVLAWVNPEVVEDLTGSSGMDFEEAIRDERVTAYLREAITKYNTENPGSSRRVHRIHLMVEPPSIDGHEITDKGYVNQRATQDRRVDLVDALFTKEVSKDVIEFKK